MSQLALARRCLVCALLGVSITALAGVDQDWATAKTANSAEGYSAFLEKHPNSKYSKDAAAALKRSRLVFVKQSNDVRAMEMFVKLYPEGPDTEDLNP